MADRETVKRAEMACRIYLKLYDAGPEGAPILKEDAMGSHSDADADLDDAMTVISRFMDDTIVDEPSHRDGVPHYALTAAMRDRMAEAMGGKQPLADQLRADVAKADRGEDVPAGDWLDAEAMIRTGQLGGEPL